VADEAAVAQHMAARGWAVQAGAPLRLGSGPAIRINLAALGLRDVWALARRSGDARCGRCPDVPQAAGALSMLSAATFLQ
jgi:hypothetical protein